MDEYYQPGPGRRPARAAPRPTTGERMKTKNLPALVAALAFSAASLAPALAFAQAPPAAAPAAPVQATPMAPPDQAPGAPAAGAPAGAPAAAPGAAGTPAPT